MANDAAEMNVINLYSNVATESNSFNEAGNLSRKRGVIYENVLLQKHHVAPPVKKDHQRFSSSCPHEHSEDLKGQQDTQAHQTLSLKSQHKF